MNHQSGAGVGGLEDVELRRLRAFVAVAEELHFGRAAARLGMSQPPLSQHIRRLEEALGVLLFDRNRRRVRLTDAGAVLLREARRILDEAERLRETARSLREGSIGHLRVGFVGSALYGVMPKLLAAFRRTAPAVALSLHEGISPQLVEDVRLGRLDVAFVRPPVPRTQLPSRALAAEPLLAVLPASHPLAGGDGPLPLAALSTEPFVLFPRQLGPGFLDAVLRACHEAGFVPAATHTANQIHTMVGLVAAGLGVSLVPEPVSNLRVAGVAYRPLAAPAPRLGLSLTWRPEAAQPAVEAFVAVTCGTLP